MSLSEQPERSDLSREDNVKTGSGSDLAAENPISKQELSAVSEDNILPEGTERAGRANLDDVLQEERALDEAVEGVAANDPGQNRAD